MEQQIQMYQTEVYTYVDGDVQKMTHQNGKYGRKIRK